MALRILFLVLSLAVCASAFAPAPRLPARAAARSRSAGAARRGAAGAAAPLRMGFMDGLNKAFANDEQLPPAKNAGISGKGPAMIKLDICGRKIEAVKGQKLKDVIRASRAPIKFDCEKGDCGSCESFVDGKKMRVCRVSVTKPVTIKSAR